MGAAAPCPRELQAGTRPRELPAVSGTRARELFAAAPRPRRLLGEFSAMEGKILFVSMG